VPRRLARTDLSRFDRIVILPTSTAREPARAAPTTVTMSAAPPPPPPPEEIVDGVARLIGQDGQPVPDDQQDLPPVPSPAPAAAQPAAAQPMATTPSVMPVGSAVPGMVVPAQPPRPSPQQGSAPEP
jgi:hypothetical protein